MAAAFDDALDAVFASDLALAAVFVPQVGLPTPCRVIRRAPDVLLALGEITVSAATNVFEVRASEIARPRAGDALRLGALGGPADPAFVIQSAPTKRDPDRLVWTLDCHAKD